MTIGIRAEDIEIAEPSTPAADVLRGRVLVVEPLGPHDLLTVSLADEHAKVQTRPNVDVRANDEIRLRLQPDGVIWLDPEYGPVRRLIRCRHPDRRGRA